MLSLIVFLPLVGALVLLLMAATNQDALRRFAFLISLIPFALSLALLARFDGSSAAYQFTEKAAWISQFNINYAVGVDGISLFLVLLTTFLMPLVILNAWGDVHKRLKEHFIVLLVLETGMLGALVATDLFLFYVFWEVMLIPMYFLIGIWGGERRVYAAVKMVLYTMAGSLLMLVAVVYVAVAYQQQTGQFSFDILKLYDATLPLEVQRWLFLAFALAFAIKVPMFPLHTWLPDAHTEAPTGGSVILAGVMLKMGTYGFLRFAIPMFPLAAHEALPHIATLAAIGIVYGALVCMIQPDLKRLVAYSSVSHLGFVMLGMAAFNVQGLQGSLLQMLNHGISTGALFLCVGIIYERRHTRLIREFGGLWQQMPKYAVVFLIVMMSSVGLPGLNGFVGEFLILLGSFQTYPVAATVGSSGVLLGAVYMLWMYQRVMFGPLNNEKNKQLSDLSSREVLVFLPLLALMFVVGMYPKAILSRMEPSVEALVTRMEQKMVATSSPKGAERPHVKHAEPGATREHPEG